MPETPLKLINDINMLLMIESGIRGGISTIHKYARANISDAPYYGRNKEPIDIMYWDGNN